MKNHEKIIKLLKYVDKAEDKEIELEIDEELETISVELFNSNEFEEGQIGYHIDENGDDLSGNEPGDWKKEWIVIGTDSYVGDPVFVDMNGENYAVYTAEHGEGNWEPISIGYNLEDIIKEIKGKQE